MPPNALALFTAHPLPWTAVCDPICARLVAANDATVLALSPDDEAIARDLAAIINASSPALHHALTALADTLVTIDQHLTDGDAADALIAAAEAVLDAAALPRPAHA